MGEYSFLTSLEEESKHSEKLLMLKVLDCVKYCLCRKNMKFNSRIRPHLRDYIVSGPIMSKCPTFLQWDTLTLQTAGEKAL